MAQMPDERYYGSVVGRTASAPQKFLRPSLRNCAAERRFDLDRVMPVVKDLHIDELLFDNLRSSLSPLTGMAAVTAISFVLLGGALILSRHRRGFRLDKYRVGPKPHPAGSVDHRGEETAGPVKILIAEDSPNSRLPAKLFLETSPYQLAFEVDGKAAVDRMPVIDGLATTRVIRVLDRERGADWIPNIALTARAALDDIEKYMRPLKPIEIAQRECPEPIGVQIPPGLEDLVPSYLAARRREVHEMTELLALTELLAASDFERLSLLGHNIKGTARGYGFTELAPLGAALEQSAERMDRETLHTQLTTLGNYLDRVQLVAQKDNSTTKVE
jgi:CheY-like chemotaxis protein